jgi:hypothetical protein
MVEVNLDLLDAPQTYFSNFLQGLPCQPPWELLLE